MEDHAEQIIQLLHIYAILLNGPFDFFFNIHRCTPLRSTLTANGIAAFDDNACAAGNSLNKGFDANLQHGGSNAGTLKTVSFELLDLSILHTGTNTITAELHQGRHSSSDIWFHLTDLALSNEEVVYQTDISLSMGADESQMNFTW